ncbi:MAG: hypothetical protein ACMXYG_07455 [Candidatus Woesearchaeota archaeon]
MRKKKAAIQLSMSFLVMLIIAIVVFVLSVIFLGHFFIQASDLKLRLDEQTRMQIETLLAGNTRVAIPIDTRTVRGGNTADFAVGIKNTLPEPYFKVDIDPMAVKFIPIEDRNRLIDVSCADGLCYIQSYGGGSGEQRYDSSKPAIQYLVGNNGERKIEMNRDSIILVAAQPLRGAPAGHYIFTLRVCNGEHDFPTSCTAANTYDNTVHKIHVINR